MNRRDRLQALVQPEADAVVPTDAPIRQACRQSIGRVPELGVAQSSAMLVLDGGARRLALCGGFQQLAEMTIIHWQMLKHYSLS